ncbi:MAG: MerC domain-containing protein [Bacteroidota bacterium]
MKNYFIGLHADFFGFMASLLCLIHCLCLPFLLSVLPLVGATYLENPMVEGGLLLLSLLVTGFAFRKHLKGSSIFQLPIYLALAGFVIIFSAGFTATEAAEISVKAIGVLLVCAAHFTHWKVMQSK